MRNHKTPCKGRKETIHHENEGTASHGRFKRFEEQVLVGELTLLEVIRSGFQLMPQHAIELDPTSFLGRNVPLLD